MIYARHIKTTIQPMSTPPDDKLLEKDVCTYIFGASSAMIGVCLTVIGIIKLITSREKIDTLVDEFLALDALIFLCSCLASYAALRRRHIKRLYKAELLSDYLFITGLIFTVFICGLILYTVAIP